MRKMVFFRQHPRRGFPKRPNGPRYQLPSGVPIHRISWMNWGFRSGRPQLTVTGELRFNVSVAAVLQQHDIECDVVMKGRADRCLIFADLRMLDVTALAGLYHAIVQNFFWTFTDFKI